MAVNSAGTASEAAANEKAGPGERFFALLQRHGALAVLVLVVAVSAFAFDRFFTFRNLENVVVQSSFLGLIAVGMTFVIISKGIDLSVGSLLALGGVLALVLPYLRVPCLARVALGWIGLVALVLCGVLIEVSTLFPGYVALWPTGAAVLVIVAGTTGSRLGADRLLSGHFRSISKHRSPARPYPR
jgi:ribose/xylose/arabinose/galactoside ABC-type transport system permease subunit